MFLVFWICTFLCKLRVFRGAKSSDKREFSSENVWFFVAYWYISYCLSHPFEIFMQILGECALPHILDTSMKVFDRFFFWVKKRLRQWKSRISGDRVLKTFIFIRYFFSLFQSMYFLSFHQHIIDQLTVQIKQMISFSHAQN